MIIKNALYLSIEFSVVCVQFHSERTPVDISLTYIINKMGPKIVPWGTPDFTKVHDEWLPLKTTRCDPAIKKVWKEGRQYRIFLIYEAEVSEEDFVKRFGKFS